MRVDRAYKGVSEKTLVLFDDGMCDGPDLQVGEQYLMYTNRFGNGDVPSRGCNRSAHVKYADEDLKYLNGLAEAVPTATIFGKVVARTDDYYGKDQPVAGVLVDVSGPTSRYTTTTDADGHYWLGGLEPEEYVVTANQPGFRMLSFDRHGKPQATRVEARGCAVRDMILRRKWEGGIAGRVTRSNGEPAPPDLDMTLILLEDRDGKERSHALFGGSVRTNEEGEYSFSEVAPGRYKIVMNKYLFPTARAPYPTIYWPAARSESEALAIEVADAASKHRYDFRLPPEPKSTLVKGMVLSSEGQPAQGARVHIEALPNNGIGREDENTPTTDATGSFSFTALAGFEYRLRASSDGERWVDSDDVSFSLAKVPQVITLVLNGPGRSGENSTERTRKREDPQQRE
jgi:hypothetical protein